MPADFYLSDSKFMVSIYDRRETAETERVGVLISLSNLCYLCDIHDAVLELKKQLDLS